MTSDALTGRLFVGVPIVAEILESDERTVRRAIAAGEIPHTRVGTKYMVPTEWLRTRAGLELSAPIMPEPDLDELAERVVDRVLTRLGQLFAGALALHAATARSVSPDPAAAIITDQTPAKEQSRVRHSTPQA